jgi:hypothetical protein
VFAANLGVPPVPIVPLATVVTIVVAAVAVVNVLAFPLTRRAARSDLRAFARRVGRSRSLAREARGVG